MPRVPLVTRQVATRALPGARLTAAETPLSRGAGLSEEQAATHRQLSALGGQVGEAATTIGNVVAAERRRADETALLDADNQLSEWTHRRLYDPQNGAMAQKGQDSFGLPEQVGGEFNEAAGTIEGKLSTDRQRVAFQRTKLQRQSALDLQLRQHVFGEMQTYEGQELQSSIVNNRNEAIAASDDPRLVGIALGRSVDAIKIHGPRLGLGPEQIAQRVEAEQTAVHSGVIERLLATDQDKQAQVYFEETRSQISGPAIARIEAALQAGNTRRQAQEETERILSEPWDSLEQRRAAAKEIDDPEVRDQVLQRLEHEDAVADKAKRDADEAQLRGVYDIVDKTHNVNNIPAGTWSRLDGSQRSALHGYANALARGIPIETDLPTYYNMMTLASEHPDQFLTTNLLQYRDRLGETEFKQLTGVQFSIRQGNRAAADNQLSDFRTHNELVTDTLFQYTGTEEKDYTTPQRAAKANLMRMVDQYVASEQSAGHKVTNEQVRERIGQIMAVDEKVPQSFWQRWNPFGGAASKKLIDVTIADITPDDRRQLEQSLRLKRRPVTDTTILDLYRFIHQRPGQ